MKRRVSPLDYAFAIGQVRALENFLIQREVFEEAADSGLEEALRLFVEADSYSAQLLHVKDSRQLEELLSKELESLQKQVSALLLDAELQDLLHLDSLADISKAASSVENEFIRDYLRHYIDLYNIKSFLRLQILGEPLERLEKVLGAAGFIPSQEFVRLYHQDVTALINRMEFVQKGSATLDYAYYLAEAIHKVTQQRNFLYIEKAINDFLIQILRPAKYICFGPEPIIAYYFAKVNEIHLIRMIVLAKFNALPQELWKERLNAVYA
jgi:V/A-type H+-transporting ATPase subunit C